jgi:glycosyltransferase involved in cell wall biosynthesis
LNATQSYPRVLILSRTEISEFNSQGAALGGWFREWPKDRLAHMYSTTESTVDTFCGHNYVLTGRERRFGGLFDWFKRLAGRRGDAPQKNTPTLAKQAGRLSRWVRTLRQWGYKWLVDTGLYEVTFPARLSPQLLAWIDDFRPEVIYANVTDLGYTQFALLLHERLGIPVCLDIVDDWPNTHYQGGFPSSWVRPIVDRTIRRLLGESAICLTIGKEMERDYRSRYPGKFEALMCCDEPERFLTAQPRRNSPDDEITIAYCGNLALNRWKTFLDLLEAVDGLRAKGMQVGVNLYSSEYPHEAAEAMARHECLRFMPTPPHDEIPQIFKGSDILFHTEAFGDEFRYYVHLSISSKSQVYMISGTPILVYGPPEAGVVKYARDSGWAYVVDRPDRMLLQEAIVRLGKDRQLRGKLADAAKATFYENHNAVVVRERLRQLLSDIAASQ